MTIKKEIQPEVVVERSNDTLITVLNTMDKPQYGIPANSIGKVTYGIYRSGLGMREVDNGRDISK